MYVYMYFGKICFSGKWFTLKMFVFKILLFLRKRKQKAAVSKSGGAGYGIKSRSSIDEMDCLQTLCDDEMVSSLSLTVSESNRLSLKILHLFVQHRLVFGYTVYKQFYHLGDRQDIYSVETGSIVPVP